MNESEIVAYLFTFSYGRIEPYYTLCEKGTVNSCNKKALDGLARICIEKYLCAWGIKQKDINPTLVKVYKMDKNLKCGGLIHEIDEIDYFIPILNK